MAIEAIAKENETIGFQNNTQILLLLKISMICRTLRNVVAKSRVRQPIAFLHFCYLM